MTTLSEEEDRLPEGTPIAASSTSEYLARSEDADPLRAIVLEHMFRGVSFAQFVERIRSERRRFEDGYFRPPSRRFLATLVIVADRLDYRGIAKTAAVWRRQSCPWVDVRVVPAAANFDTSSMNTALAAWYQQLPIQMLPEAHRSWDRELSSDFVIFARPGDSPDPSVALALSAAVQESHVDLFTWNELFRSEQHKPEPLFTSVRDVWRRPKVESVTLRHVAYIGLGFAVRADLVSEFPGDLLADLSRNEGHLFQNWLFAKGCCARSSPEYLSTRAYKNRPRSPKSRIADRIDLYKEFFEEHAPEFDFHITGIESQPYVLSPVERAKSISVVISFRNQAELTSRCIRSIADQETAARVEIVLIDNQSKPAGLNEVKVALAKLKTHVQWKILEHDAAFNHSAQCNLGVEAATGEVVVLMNNDAQFLSRDALDELAAWALIDNIGTVGPRVVSKDRKVSWTGMAFRSRLVGYDDFPVFDSRDRRFEFNVREVLGTSFAVSAIAREKFLGLGGLDPVGFPAGYNDVDFSLRAQKAGFASLYLGHVTAMHKRGATRKKADEHREQMLLRANPILQMDRQLFQLESDSALLRRVDPARQTARRQSSGNPNTEQTTVERMMRNPLIASLLKIPAIRRSARAIYHASTGRKRASH